MRVLIYEYLPHELARLGVIARAAGLDRHQVAVQVYLAQERAGRARVCPAEPHHLSELFIAELRRLQWERIAAFMDGEQVAAYAPSGDLRAVRCEEHRLQRLMADVAEAERCGRAALEISRHRVYRIGARPVAGRSRPVVPGPVVHLMAVSADDAAERAWVVHGRDGGLFQRTGYRIASVEQVLPEPGELF
ncbi:hypothetical protein ACIRU3_44860 [Streptomyces sp. NPDC101151]|uniref:hypothetical protein n=1 Tax=Streptomyces sp. NPDC101151 TaxID=3366115 RepID=UPI0037F7280B